MNYIHARLKIVGLENSMRQMIEFGYFLDTDFDMHISLHHIQIKRGLNHFATSNVQNFDRRMVPLCAHVYDVNMNTYVNISGIAAVEYIINFHYFKENQFMTWTGDNLLTKIFDKEKETECLSLFSGFFFENMLNAVSYVDYQGSRVDKTMWRVFDYSREFYVPEDDFIWLWKNMDTDFMSTLLMLKIEEMKGLLEYFYKKEKNFLVQAPYSEICFDLMQYFLSEYIENMKSVFQDNDDIMDMPVEWIFRIVSPFDEKKWSQKINELLTEIIKTVEERQSKYFLQVDKALSS